MRVVLLGTYDLGKPRTRLLRECMRRIDPTLREVHVDVWRGVEDKSVTGTGARLRTALRLAFAYPLLALRYLFTGRHDVVVIGYMGLFDMLLLAPLAKLRGKRVVWDAFLSIYDTYARDRGMASEANWKARLLRWMEKTACRIADVVVLDTKAHAALMGELHGVPNDKLAAVLVGAEGSVFEASRHPSQGNTGESVEVLFYGQFIPLHGIDTIITAALDPRGRHFRWTIVGQGQEAARIDARLTEQELPHVTRIPWVEYGELADLMARADVCLGIFGTSDKASRVIPNKVYQAILAGKPLVTRDSPAIRELADDDTRGLYLVPPDDPSSLLEALDRFAAERADLSEPLHGDLTKQFSMPALTRQWLGVLHKGVAA